MQDPVPSFDGPIKGVMGRAEKAKEPEPVRRPLNAITDRGCCSHKGWLSARHR